MIAKVGFSGRKIIVQRRMYQRTLPPVVNLEEYVIFCPYDGLGCRNERTLSYQFLEKETSLDFSEERLKIAIVLSSYLA